MAKMIHACLSVRGALRWNDAKLEGMLSHPDGCAMMGDEVREVLFDQLAAGREVIPFGEPCEGFSYIDGCPGHETED